MYLGCFHNMKGQLYLKFSSPSTTCSSLQAKLSVFKLIRPPSPRILAMWLDERSRCFRCLSLSRFSITEILLQWRFKEIKPESRWTSNRLLICASIKQISFGNVWETISKLFFPVAILHYACCKSQLGLDVIRVSWRAIWDREGSLPSPRFILVIVFVFITSNGWFPPGFVFVSS